MPVFEEGRLVRQAQIVEELEIKAVRSVVATQVVNVDEIGAAATLCLRPQSERPAPREVGDRGDATPVPNSEGDERGVVVAVTDGRFQAYSRGLITQHCPAEFPAGTRVQAGPNI